MASRRPTSLLLLAAFACSAAPHPSARAQEASRPPATERATPDPDRPQARPGGDRLRQPIQRLQQQQQQQQGDGGRAVGWPFHPGKLGPNAPTPSDDEWQQTARFLAEISPGRWQAFDQVLSKPARAERARRFLFARYSELRELERANPGLYDARIEQVRAEDDLFKIDSQLREARSPGEAEALRRQLGARAAEWVKKDLDQREARLKELQNRLDREKEALAIDRQRIDEIAERRTDVIRRSSERFRAWVAGKFAPAAGSPSPSSSD